MAVMDAEATTTIVDMVVEAPMVVRLIVLVVVMAEEYTNIISICDIISNGAKLEFNSTSHLWCIN